MRRFEQPIGSQNTANQFGGHDFSKAALFITTDENGNEVYEPVYPNPEIENRQRDMRGAATLVITLGEGPVTIHRPHANN